ncbi:hypothetical protein CWE12_01125 [Aliidiomarina sedimenti]|uniref:Cellulose synthase operon protein YhjQ n=1 Tax=Aliidiomarina sedimenti TaxID=1933879 RepID=A0ABY0C1H0_9GAMM|nr:cellulose synthase operon protein YhjQ/BcsQ [Aliidiomarina sedimenti]RUO31631.1 hypothetical protein CWE12_01125 [Aliidiomarina sedimenti]
MLSIGIVSLTPGAGAKTLCANLANELATAASPTLAVDLTPENMLRLHFGMPLEDRRGLINQDPLEVFEYPSGVHYLPYGESLQGASSQLDRDQSANGSQLTQVLERLPDDYTYCCINLGTISLGTRDLNDLHELQNSLDILLCVLEPAPLTYAYLYRGLSRDLRSTPQSFSSVYFVFNKVAPNLTLNKDILNLLKAELNPRILAPMMVHHDQHVPEALATQQPVVDYAIASRAAGDFEALALWLKTVLK